MGAVSWAVAVMLGAAVGCGSGGDGAQESRGDGAQESRVSGTVKGASLHAKDSWSSVSMGPGGASANVMIGSFPKLCALAGDPVANSARILMFLTDLTPGARVTPGTRRVNGTLGSIGTRPGETNTATWIADLEANRCGDVPELYVDATSGSVQLTRVSSDFVTGSFDLTFPDGDQLSGAFNAPSCDAFGDKPAVDASVDAGPETGDCTID